MVREIDFSRVRPFDDWLNRLSLARADALEAMHPDCHDYTPFTAREVLEAVIDYQGGISSADELVYLLADVFGWR